LVLHFGKLPPPVPPEAVWFDTEYIDVADPGVNWDVDPALDPRVNRDVDPAVDPRVNRDVDPTVGPV